ncbi:MAG: hypothetical protein IJX12_05860 [Lachnospiraceae bacterium]|nr:hypothetical protein [Lachnospiraceae bacterium]
MDNQPKNNFQIIQQSNLEMLNYFNNAFLDNLEQIQQLKTQVFEIDIKIDELEKTRNIYAFKSTSRKSVFTPTTSDDMESERSKIIDEQIKDLLSVKESLYTKIQSLELSINAVKKRLALLNDAESAINNVAKTVAPELLFSTDNDEEGDFEFVRDSAQDTLSSHGYNILMLDAFEKAFYSTLIDRNIKDGVVSMHHKLEMLSYLLSTDINRAKITLQELVNNSKKIIEAVDDVNGKLDSKINSSQPIWNVMDEFIMQQRDKHPECIIDANIECTDYETNLHPVFTINLISLLNIFFDNIFKHSNANKIKFRLSISANKVDAYISDNGVGIDPDYLTKSPWYSSLHKAHEIIYLLGGTLIITGDIISGTTIRFDFPIQE